MILSGLLRFTMKGILPQYLRRVKHKRTPKAREDRLLRILGYIHSFILEEVALPVNSLKFF